ncbi:MAG: hypothetical protein J7459_00120 [Chloroflexus sp.]|nr:hypothetical protein [Chloroflexus sp.]
MFTDGLEVFRVLNLDVHSMTERFNNGATPMSITHPLLMTPVSGSLEAQTIGSRAAVAAMEPTPVARSHDADGSDKRMTGTAQRGRVRA